MNEQKRCSPQEMLAAFSISDRNPRLFQIGCFAQRLTLHAQQIRAFNLIWALIETGTLFPDAKIGIVGGGLAGITAAAACHAYGCKVILYEQYADVLHLQRGNRLRYLHPNIYDWPRHEAEDNRTRHLPFLSWTAGFCDEVAEQILDQWQMVEKRIEVWRHSEVTRVQSGDKCVELEVNGDPESKAVHDVVILCVGYGDETTLPDTQRLSYWQNDSLCQPVFFKAKKRILVTGCGDGGLTDALRLTLKDFNHARFILDIAITFSQDLRLEISRIDGAAYEHLDAQKDGVTTVEADLQCRLFLNAEYEKLALPPMLIEYVQQNRRQDTEVVLNNRGPVPLTLEASPINRFAVHCLMRAGAIQYRPGDPTITRNSDGTYAVRFPSENPGGHVEDVFDDVIVRRGVEPVISRLIASEDFARLKSNALRDRDDFTRFVHFPGVKFLQEQFNSIRASFSANDALWYQVDFFTDTSKRPQAEYVDNLKSFVRGVSERIDATLVDDNDYKGVSDRTHVFTYMLEKDGARAIWTARVPRSETTQAGAVVEVSYQLITYFKTDSRVLLDLILGLELMPYQRYVMGVPAGTFFNLDPYSTIHFRELAVRGQLDSSGVGPSIELACAKGMYHAHDSLTIKDCVRLLRNEVSGIILDLYNKITSRKEDYVKVEENLQLTISATSRSVRQWSARDMLP